MLLQAKADLPDGRIGGSYDPSITFYKDTARTQPLTEIAGYTELEVVIASTDTIEPAGVTLTPGSGLTVDGVNGQLILDVDTTQLQPGDYSYYVQWNDGSSTRPQFPVGGSIAFKKPGSP